MSAAEMLRNFINERLDAVAEEIIEVVEKTLMDYEKEMDRQRVLLDIFLKPQVRLQKLGQEEVVNDQQLSIPDQEKPQTPQVKMELQPTEIMEEPQPPQIKEERDELFINMEREPMEPDEEEEEVADNFEIEWEVSPLKTNQLSPQMFNEVSDAITNKVSLFKTKKVSGLMQKRRQSRGGRRHSVRAKMAQSQPQDEKYYCSYCRLPHRTKKNLFLHMTMHTGEMPFHCGSCGTRFETKSSAITHLSTHKGETFIRYEAELLSDTSNVDAHGRNITRDRPFFCIFCGQKHIQQKDMIRHMTRHGDGLMLPCNTCGKNFRTTHYLKDHMRMHSLGKMYCCSHCNEEFAGRSNLILHMKSHWFGSCDTCGLKFKSKDKLVSHKKKHTGDKPFYCHICRKRFKMLKVFQGHMKRHSNEEQYTCDVCGKKFAMFENVRIHMKKHRRRNTPFSCSICQKVFLRQEDVESHVRSHHKNSFPAAHQAAAGSVEEDPQCSNTFAQKTNSAPSVMPSSALLPPSSL